MNLDKSPALREILEIVTSIYALANQSKTSRRLFWLLVLLELWVHSLMFQHLSELKNIKQLIPFFQ